MEQSFYDNQIKYNIMKLNGKGQVSVSPDVALVRLGVELAGEELAEIQEESARISQGIIDALKELEVSDIKTHQYNIDKNYSYEDGERIDRGYTVKNILEFRVSDISKVGIIIDAAVDSGANVVELISFEVSNANLYYKKALNLAIQDTLEKATSIELFLRLPMTPVPIKIVENSVPISPFSQIDTARERSFNTPILPGNMFIEAFVTVDFLY